MQKAMVRRWIAIFLLVFFLSPTPAQAQWMMQRGIPQTPVAFDLPDVIRNLKVSDVPNAGANDSAKGFPSAAEENDSHLPDSAPISKDKEKQEEEKSSSEPEGSQDLILSVDIPASKDQEHLILHESYPTSLLKQWFGQESAVSVQKSYHLHSSDSALQKEWQYDFFDPAHQQAAVLSQIQEYILTENPHPYEIQTNLPLSDLPSGDYTLKMQLIAEGEEPVEIQTSFAVPGGPSLSLREQEDQRAPDIQTLKDGIEIRMEQVTPDVLNHYLFTVSGKLRVREEILEEEIPPRIFYELRGSSGEPVDLVNILHPELEEQEAPAEVKQICRFGNLNRLTKEADGSYSFESWLRCADNLQAGDYRLTLRVILPKQPVPDSTSRNHNGKWITFEGADQNNYRYDPAGSDPLLHEQSLDFSLDEREVLRSQFFTKLTTDAENFAVQSPRIEIGEETPARLAFPVTMQTSFAKYFAPLYETWEETEDGPGIGSRRLIRGFSFPEEEGMQQNHLLWAVEYYDPASKTELVGYPRDEENPVMPDPHLRLYAARYAEQEGETRGSLLLDKPELAPGEYEFIGKIRLGELELHHSRLPLHIRAGEEEERALLQLRQQTELFSFEASFLPKEHKIHLSLPMNQKTREFLQTPFLSNEPHTQLGLLYTLRNSQGESVFETYGAHSICEKNRIPQEKRNPYPPEWEQKGENSLLRQTIGLPPLLPGGRYDLSVSLLWIRPGAQREIHTQTAALDIDSLSLPPGLDAQILSKIRFIQEKDKEISLQLQKRERLSLPLEKEAYEAMQALQQKGYSFRLSCSLQEEDGREISDLSVRVSDSELVQEEDRYLFRQEMEAERRAGSPPFPLHKAKKIRFRLLLNTGDKELPIDQIQCSLHLTGKTQDEEFLKRLAESFVLEDKGTERNYHYHYGTRRFKSRLSINKELYEALTKTYPEKLKLCFQIKEQSGEVIKSAFLDAKRASKQGENYDLRDDIVLPMVVQQGNYKYEVQLLWEEDTLLKELQIPFFIHYNYSGDSDYEELKRNAELHFTASNPKDPRILEIRGVASDICGILYHQENIYLSIQGKIKDQEGRAIRSWVSKSADSLENEIFLSSASFDRFGKGSFWMEIYDPIKMDCAFGQDLLLPSDIAEGPHTVELTLLYTNEASGVKDYPVKSFEAGFEASKQAADLPVQIHAELERPSAEGGKYSLQLRMKNPNSPPYLQYKQGLSSMQLSIYEDGQLMEQTDWTKELSSGREVRKNHSFFMTPSGKKLRVELSRRRFEGDQGYTSVKDFSLYPDPTLRIEEPGQEYLSGKGEIRLILDSNPEDQDRFKLSLYRESENGVSHPLLTGSEEIPFTKISEEDSGKRIYQAIVPVDWESIGNDRFKIVAVAKSLDRKPPLTLRAVSDRKIIHKNSDIELSFAGENTGSAVLLKKGQEQTRSLRIKNKAPVAEELTLKVQSPKDLSLELPEKIRLEGAGRQGDAAEVPLRLRSEQVQDETIEFIIKAAFDGKEYRKSLRFRVEELSDLTIQPQSRPLMIPAGQLSEPYTLQIRNNNELPDAVKLQFLSEEVQVEAENHLSLPGKGSYSLPLRLTPKKDGAHQVRILATSENDPAKTYESSLSVHTRPLIRDQYMLSFPSSQILIGEKSSREVEFSIYNSSDLPIEDIRIAADCALLDLQIEPQTIPYLEKRTSAKGKLKLQTHRDIEEDLQGEIEVSVSLHKAQPQIHKIPLRIVKARPLLKVNGGDSLLRTSANIGEEATAKLRIENAGNKEMKEIHLQPQSGLVPEKTHIASIAPGESEIVTLRIPKEENTRLGEKTYPLHVRIAPGQAKEDSVNLTVQNTVVSSETGALELEVYELSGEKRRSGTIRLTHKEVPTQTREIPLSLSSKEEAVLVEDLMVGTYVMELLSEDKRRVKSTEIEIKPDLVYQKDLHIEVEDHLFDTRFTVEKIKIDEIYDVTLTTLWEESPPGLPSLSIQGTSVVLKPGEQEERSLIVKNTGSYPLTQINLHMLPRETEVNPSVHVSFSLIGKEKLDPGESYEIPVSCSASSGAESGDYTSLAFMAEAVCEDLPAFRRTDTRVFAKASASASVHVPGPPSSSSGKGGYIHYPSSSGEGFRYRPFEGQGKELTKLILNTKIEMTREILDARLEMSGFKKDLRIKDLSVHIQNSRQEEITEQFFQKIYEGEEFTSDALIQKGQEAKVGWYLADENLDIGKEETFFAYAKIHYEADGKPYTKTTEKASFTLKPRAFLQMDYHVPNYLREGRSYDIDIIISNTGKGEAELTGITNSYLLQGEAKISVRFDNISAGVIKKGEKLTLKAKIKSDRDLKLVSSDLKVEYKNSLQLPLKQSIRTNFILKDTGADAAIDAFRRQKAPDPRSCINDPIDLSSGAQVIQKEVLSLSGSLPMTYTLSYHSMLRDPGENGNGWSSIYEMKVVPAAKSPMKEKEETSVSSAESVIVHYSNTKRNLFVKQSEANAVITYATSDPDRYKDRLTASENGYILEKQGGVRYRFDAQGKLSQIIYKEDARIDIRREGDTTTIADAQSDRFLRLHYDEKGRVSKVTDHSGREAKLTYDDKGNLLCIQDPMGRLTRYTYDEQGRIEKGYTPGGELQFANTYGEKDRIIAQTDEYGKRTRIRYEETKDQLISHVTDRNGEEVHYLHDKDSGRLLEIRDSLGLRVKNTYDKQGNLLSATNGEGETTSYQYDAGGHLLRVSAPQGESVQAAYDEKGNLLRLTDERGHESRFTYDEKGKLTAVQDPLGHGMQLRYGPGGQVLSLTLADKTSFHYQSENGKIISSKDDKNRGNTLSYNAMGLPVRIEDAKGSSLQMEYDASGHLKSLREKNGGLWKFSYDENGRLQQRENPMGGKRSFRWDLYGNLLEETDEAGERTVYAYDGESRLLQLTYPDGAQIRYAYDVRGNLLQIQNENGDTEERSYDKADRLLQKKSPQGRITRYAYDKNGRLQSILSPGGGRLQFTYDESGNLLRLEDAQGVLAVHAYDAGGRKILSKDAAGKEIAYTYDEMGNLTKISEEGAEEQYRYEDRKRIERLSKAGDKQSYAYDDLGRLVRITDSRGNSHHLSYDEMGSLTRILDPLGCEERFTYDLLQRKTAQIDKNGGQTSYAYDSRGDLITLQNALGESVHFTYDPRRRLTGVTQGRKKIAYRYDRASRLIEVSDALGNTTRYTYDKDGDLLQIEDDLGLLASYEYDAEARVIAERDALGNRTAYTYDLRGNLLQKTSPSGRVTAYTYDGQNRLTAVQDEEDLRAAYTYDAAGRLTGIRMGEQSRSLRYDRAGRLKESVLQLAEQSRSERYTYGAEDLLEEYQNGRGQRSRFAYDAAGRLIRIQDPEGTTTFTYDPAGNLLRVQGKQGEIKREYDALHRVIRYEDAHRRVIRYTYDEEGNCSRITYPALSRRESEKTVSYTYDPAGNLQTVTDWNGNTYRYTYDLRGRQRDLIRPDQSREKRTYDARGQIIELSDQDKEGNLLLRQQLSYDSEGNILEKTAEGALQPPSVSEDEEIFLTHAHGMLYTADREILRFDADGNIIHFSAKDRPQDLRYDSQNRLIRVNKVRYAYDSEGTRMEQKGRRSKTTYVTDVLHGNLLIAQDKKKQGTFYLYGNGLLAQEDRSGTAYYHYDAQGNTRLLRSEEGESLASFCYDPHGNLLSHTGQDTPFRYSGKYGVQTDESGLLYMRSRYYSPDLRQFLSADRYMGDLYHPASLNPYSYVEGNPVRYIDPMGYWATPFEKYQGHYSLGKDPERYLKILYNEAHYETDRSLHSLKYTQQDRKLLRQEFHQLLYETHPYCIAGRDFMRGTADAIDNNAYGGAAQGIVSIQNPQVMVKPRTEAYYVGKLSADWMMFVHGLAAMAAGGAMMGGGAAASSTGAGTLVGAPAVVEGLAIAEYGMFVASNSMTNIQNDFEEAAKGIGGSNQGVNPLERSKGDFDHIKSVPEIERKFNLPKGSYHPKGKKGIKKEILRDAQKYFPKEMKKIGTNPDLAFAKDGQVMIVSQTDKSLSVVTDLNIYHYIE